MIEMCINICVLFQIPFPYVCMYVSCSVVSNSLWPHGAHRLLCPWTSPGRNTGMGWHSLLQGIFPTQGLNPGLLHCRQILYCLEPPERPLFPYGLLQNIEYSLCYKVGICCLCILCIVVCLCSFQIPSLSPALFPFGECLFSMWVFLFYKWAHLYLFFKILHVSVIKYLFLSVWLHSEWQSLGPSMLLQMALFHVCVLFL